MSFALDHAKGAAGAGPFRTTLHVRAFGVGEDRYHATAIQTDDHLHRCLVCIDLNMVRAGVVTHPEQWKHAPFNEIQAPPQRYTIIDVEQLASLCGRSSVEELQVAHRHWVEDALVQYLKREERWSRALAVGGNAFVEHVQQELGCEAGIARSKVTKRLMCCAKLRSLTIAISDAKWAF